MYVRIELEIKGVQSYFDGAADVGVGDKDETNSCDPVDDSARNYVNAMKLRLKLSVKFDVDSQFDLWMHEGQFWDFWMLYPISTIMYNTIYFIILSYIENYSRFIKLIIFY